jgi:serine/threonine-protein phosphatase 2A regulatory subunit A
MADAMKYVRAMLGKLPADADEPVIVDQLQCVSRLRVISLALGAEAMQKDLIPFILELCEETKVEPPRRLVDEVLTSLAEMLGSMDEFVGAKNAHILFKPLTILCSVDETTVRQQAVDSINKLSAALSPAQVAEHLGGEVIKLMENTDWFTPRVSGVGLVATTYAKVAEASLKSVPITRFSGESQTMSSEEMARELAECFRKCCVDTLEPMVRRTAALKLQEAAKAFGPARIREDLVPVYMRLIEDTEQESIRVNALKSSPAIFTVASLSGEVGEAFLACVNDKSWRVRVAVAEALSSVSLSVAKGDKGAWEGGDLKTAQSAFTSLLTDHEAEVRLATAAQIAAATSILTAEWARTSILPVLKELVMDENVANRVITKLDGLVEVLGIENAEPVIADIHALCEDKNWRVRWAAIWLFPDLAHRMSIGDFKKQTEANGGFHKCAYDNCALIRTDYVNICMAIAELPGKGELVTTFVNIVKACADQKPYQHRAVLLLGASNFIKHSSATDLVVSELLPSAKVMLEDRVPNLRLLAATCFVEIFKAGYKDFSGAADIKAVLEKMEELVRTRRMADTAPTPHSPALFLTLSLCFAFACAG